MNMDRRIMTKIYLIQQNRSMQLRRISAGTVEAPAIPIDLPELNEEVEMDISGKGCKHCGSKYCGRLTHKCSKIINTTKMCEYCCHLTHALSYCCSQLFLLFVIVAVQKTCHIALKKTFLKLKSTLVSLLCVNIVFSQSLLLSYWFTQMYSYIGSQYRGTNGWNCNREKADSGRILANDGDQVSAFTQLLQLTPIYSSKQLAIV